MRLIKPTVEIIPQKDIYSQIELAGRTCYKSENKITENSAKEFVDRMIKSGHNAMLEHGTVYLKFTDNATRTIIIDGIKCDEYLYDDYTYNKYSVINSVSNIGDTNWYVTTNYRILIENNWLEDLKYLCEPTEYHEKRHTVKFITSIGIGREFTRHRIFSFAQESTRYCNYSRGQFCNSITCIEPLWINDNREFQHSQAYDNAFEVFMSHCEESEGTYLRLIDEGFSPQQARDILPLSTKSELIMTGFASDWKHFFELRASKAAHPEAQILAYPLQEEFIKRKYI